MSERKFPDVPAVVLAAGRSARMGRNKALLPWPPLGRPCVIHVTDQLRDAGIERVGVVTGAHHDAIAAAVAGHASVVFNPAHAEGQLASLQCGLAWGFAAPEVRWVLVTLVDLPGIHAATIRRVLSALDDAGTLAVRPVVGEQHGHPVAWHRDAWPLLRAASHEHGARQIIRQLAAAGRVLDIPVDDEAVLRDIDTPAEYLQRIRGGGQT